MKRSKIKRPQSILLSYTSFYLTIFYLFILCFDLTASTFLPLIDYSRNDAILIDHFINVLKKNNGDWSKHGIQRIIRLNSECSHNYISLRNNGIRADVPIDEAFKDPYSKLKFDLKHS
jgi:hypothetical protein